MANGGKKDAKHIAGLLKPIISWIEQTKDPKNQKTDHWGVIFLVLFDGASNVHNAGKLVSITYPCITVVHGAEHVVSLFSKDIFTKMPGFQMFIPVFETVQKYLWIYSSWTSCHHHEALHHAQ
jgi:hypothetical protein